MVSSSDILKMKPFLIYFFIFFIKFYCIICLIIILSYYLIVYCQVLFVHFFKYPVYDGGGLQCVIYDIHAFFFDRRIRQYEIFVI